MHTRLVILHYCIPTIVATLFTRKLALSFELLLPCPHSNHCACSKPSWNFPGTFLEPTIIRHYLSPWPSLWFRYGHSLPPCYRFFSVSLRPCSMYVILAICMRTWACLACESLLTEINDCAKMSPSCAFLTWIIQRFWTFCTRRALICCVGVCMKVGCVCWYGSSVC